MSNHESISSPGPRPSVGPLVVFMALTIFVSAFLLFQVQPLISKLILPWFGGSPTVWTTAMLFFQCALFAGYAYSHFVTRFLPLRLHLRLHIALLALSALMSLLITPGEYLKPNGDENPALRILLLLSVCVGVPYFTLASTGPIVQAWYARIYPDKSPYRLYALSNVGSFLALLSFPYLFEPLFQLPELGRAWTLLYWLFATLCCLTAVWLMRQLPNSAVVTESETHSETAVRPSWLERSLWIFLPALASLTMIAATDHVSHNVAPEPRLWITTLGLYLLTFIVTFDHERWYLRRVVAILCLASILLLTGKSQVLEFTGLHWDFGVSELRWSHFAVMFLICFMCHGELVRLRPKASEYLTEFYLCISAGGACGGLFASIVAVNLFKDFYEWPLCLALASMVSLWILALWQSERSPAIVSTTGPIRIGVATVSSLLVVGWIGYLTDPFQWRSGSTDDYDSTRIFASRNFYGAISVEDEKSKKVSIKSFRGFYSGNVTHGIQLTTPEEHLLPVSYYGATSGIAETIRFAQSRQPSLRIAVVGLGAGSLASYGRSTDHIDFYEINPEVIHVAQTYFSFIKECKATTNIILGDGRLKLQESNDPPYDIILLDAFTGGSVPVHLLTKEAFAIYHEHLAPKGFLVVHITNAYLDLYPVVKLQAEELKMGYRSKFEAYDRKNMVRRNHYMTITNDEEFLEEYRSIYPPIYDENDEIIDRREPYVEGVTLWTDHFSSINRIERDD